MIWAGRRGPPRGPRTPARDAGCRFADLRRDLFDLLRQEKGELKLVIHLLSLKRTRKVPKRRTSKRPDPKAESVSAVRWKELTLEEHAKSLGPVRVGHPEVAPRPGGEGRAAPGRTAAL